MGLNCGWWPQFSVHYYTRHKSECVQMIPISVYSQQRYLARQEKQLYIKICASYVYISVLNEHLKKTIKKAAYQGLVTK